MEQFRGVEQLELQRVRLSLPPASEAVGPLARSGMHPAMGYVAWAYLRTESGWIRAVKIYSPWLVDKGKKHNDGIRTIEVSARGKGSQQLNDRFMLDVEIRGGKIRPRNQNRGGRLVREGRNIHLLT